VEWYEATAVGRDGLYEMQPVNGGERCKLKEESKSRIKAGAHRVAGLLGDLIELTGNGLAWCGKALNRAASEKVEKDIPTDGR